TTLAGVTVKVEGTQAATQTDGNGAYAIRANKGAHLLFSHNGYVDKRVQVTGGKVVDVHLVPAKQQQTELRPGEPVAMDYSALVEAEAPVGRSIKRAGAAVRTT